MIDTGAPVPTRDSEADVVVAGGGPAGFGAAVAAARTGARVVLLERAPFLGGTATGAMVASFMGFYWRDVLVGGGIGREVTERLVAAGGSRGFTPYVLAEASDAPVRSRTFPFDPEVLKIVLDELLDEAGVEVALHTQVTAPLVDRGTVRGLIAHGRYERERIEAPVVVDATADGVVARLAGCRTQNDAAGRRERQPMTAMARLGNVDLARFRALPREEKQRLARAGVATGELAMQLLSVVSSPSGDDGFVLMTRVAGYDGADSRDLSRAEAAGRRQVRAVLGFLRREVPGFENAYLSGLAPWIGVRETYRILGEHVLTEDDVLSGRQFADAIAQGGGPLDVHHEDGTGLTLVEPPAPFSVPYRCLVPADADGLLVAGRCASASRTAMGAMRHMGTAMATGHAAGVAAAVAADRNVPARAAPVLEVQDTLRAQGAVVDDPALDGVGVVVDGV